MTPRAPRGVDEGDGLKLSRRQVLAGATATGALGVLGVSGTGARFSDRKTFGGNSMTAGSLDLTHCWQRAGAPPCDPSSDGRVSIDVGPLETRERGSGSLRLSLPEGQGNNPAWLWGRTECPVEACGIDRKLEVSLWYETDCDGRADGREQPLVASSGEPLTTVTLCRAKSLLAEGIRLDADPSSSGPDPLLPGQDRCIGIEWELVEPLCEPDVSTLELEVVAVQRRHNSEPAVPWEPQECTVDCLAACPDECFPASFVAFCLIGRDDIARYDITHLSWTDETVTWESARDIDTLVLYYGPPTFELFRGTNRRGFPAGERHTITRGQGDEVLTATEADRAYDMVQNDPCPGSVAAVGCGVRYNFGVGEGPDDPWDCVCGPPGRKRRCTEAGTGV